MSLDIWLEVDTGGPEAFAFGSMNITHNLKPMWREVGCLEALYERSGATAGDLAPIFRAAYEAMKADPARFEKHNSPNGWGLYKHALPWLGEVASLCERNPRAIFRVSR